MRLILGLLASLFLFNAAAAQTIERKAGADGKPDFPEFAEFDAGDGVEIDNSAWNEFLSTYAALGDDGVVRVAYGAVTESGKTGLRAYVEMLEATDPTTLGSDAQLAYWINLYNAATVALIIDHYPVKSIRDIKSNPFDVLGPWNDKRLTVNSVELSLNNVEHDIIRAIFAEPRIHYAVNCASIGCPNLRLSAFEGADIDETLTEQARAYINHPRGVDVDARGRVNASRIFSWYKKDFGASDAEIIDHFRLYADDALKAKLEGKSKISSFDYDWSLNELKR